MPSSSPYQNNDYQAANSFRPYKLPINDIFKASTAVNLYWDEGARIVKNAYENALNLSLTSDQNKDFRDQYIKEAEKKMSQLSSKDLSDPSVQRQGVALFRPLISDKAIMIDDHLTKLRQSILSDADGYKDKKLSPNGTIGEGYNITNLKDALAGFDELNSNTPRDEKTFKSLYQKLGDKSYTPYYDVKGDYFKALAKCKPNKDAGNSIQGMYTLDSSNASLDADKLAGCVQAGLSDQGRNQLMIEARVNYRGNERTLATRYIPHLVSVNKQSNETIAKLQAEMQGKIDAKTITPEEKDAYDQMISNERTQELNTKSTISRLQLGDMTPITDNFDNVAYSIYSSDSIEGFANAFYNIDKKSEFKSSASEIAKFNQGQKNLQQEDEQTFTAEQNALNRENDLTKSVIAASTRIKNIKARGGDPASELISVIGTAEETSRNKLVLNGYMDEAKTAKNNALDNIYDVAKRANIFTGEVLDNNFGDVVKAVNSYIEQFKDKPEEAKANQTYTQLVEYYNDWLSAISREKNYQSTLTAAENKAQQKIKISDVTNQLVEETVNKAGDFYINDYNYKNNSQEQVLITKDRMRNILKGNDVDYEIDQIPSNTGASATGSSSYTNIPSGSGTNDVTVLRKRDGSYVYLPNANIVDKFLTQTNQEVAKYNKEVDVNLGGIMDSQHLIYSAPKGIEEDIKKRFAVMGPETQLYLNDKDYEISAGKYDPRTGAVEPIITKLGKDGKPEIIPFKMPANSAVGAGIVTQDGKNMLLIPETAIVVEDPNMVAYKMTANRLLADGQSSSSEELFRAPTGGTVILTVDKPKGKPAIFKVGTIPVGSKVPIYDNNYSSSNMENVINKAIDLQNRFNYRQKIQ